MYALFAICNALSPSRLDDNILNIVKDRYGDQFAKLSRGCVLRMSRPCNISGTIYFLHAPTAMMAFLPLKSCFSTRAQSSYPPTHHRMMIRSNWRLTRKILRRSPPSTTSRSSWPTCARRRPCRHCAASSSCILHSTPRNLRASLTRTKKRWFSR